jgi:hypothetical protein
VNPWEDPDPQPGDFDADLASGQLEVTRHNGRPILLLDVDGVLCPWGSDLPSHYTRIYHEDSDDCDYVSQHNAREILKLADHYDIMWCSAREEDVYRSVGPAHGFPPWPIINLGTKRMVEGSLAREHIVLPNAFETAIALGDYYIGPQANSWKLPFVRKLGDETERPIIWVDDHLGEDVDAWAALRSVTRAPTSLVRVDPAVGLTEADYEALRAFLVALGQ